MNDLLVAAASGVVCAVAALGLPPVIARLPEPDPEPAEGVTPSVEQQLRAEEPPKQLYADIAASPRLPPVLALTSLVAGALVGLHVGAGPVLLLLLPLVPVGAALGVVDLHTRLLPGVPVLAATAYALLYVVLDAALTASAGALVRGLVGLVVARSVFWVLWVVHPRGMGFGDVRLAALLGLVLGHLGWAELVVGLYSPFLLFGLPGLVLALVRRDRALLKKGYPFGPFLLAGAVLGVVAGGPVVDALVG